MSIAQSGGPHTVDIYIVSNTLAEDRSPQESYSIQSSSVRCFVQSTNSTKSEKVGEIGKTSSAMITFFTDPGFDINQKYLFLYTNPQGVVEYHTFEGCENQSNLNRVFNVSTSFSNQKPGFFTVS